MSTGEISTKPYLLRALHEWCVDNGYTPHLAVKVDARTQVPVEYVQNGEITLNISPGAVHKLQLGNELIEFSARFDGVARQICVPVANVYALYARETGNGMRFETEPAVPADPAQPESVAPASASLAAPEVPPEPPRPAAGGRPALRRVK